MLTNSTSNYRGEHPQRNAAPHRYEQGLQICWINTAKRSPCHIAALEIAWQQQMDVICVQEPFTAPGTKTSTHPGYTHYAPVTNWDNPETRESERPRVMTYVRKGASLQAQIIHPRISRDLLWVRVNGYSILNVYREPFYQATLDYVTQISPPPQCLIGGDFNVRHGTFEPGSSSAHGGAEIVRWADRNSLDFIGEPGEPTHRAGHVLDLTFSNIPFAETSIRDDMYTGSDHFTLVTTVPARGQPALEQFHYRVPEARLPRFAGMVELNVQGLSDPSQAVNPSQLDECVTALTDAIKRAVESTGKLDREVGRSAPWWTAECREAYRHHLNARAPLGQAPSDATRNFRSEKSKTCLLAHSNR